MAIVLGLLHSSWRALDMGSCFFVLTPLFFCDIFIHEVDIWDDLKDGIGWRAFQGATD